MKILYKFKVKVGEQEHEIALKDLGRRDRESLAVVYNAEYCKAINKGLLPWAALRKSALDSGGFWSNNEVNYADGIVRKIQEVSNEIQKLTTEEKDVSELKKNLESLMAEFQEYKQPETELFSKSADYEAKKNSIVWIVLKMTFVKKDDYEFLFPGISDESRLDYSYECFDSETKELEKKAFEKAYMCFYHAIENGEKNSEVFDLLVNDKP